MPADARTQRSVTATIQQGPQLRLHRRPLAVQNREIHRVPIRSIGVDHVLAQRPLFRGADAKHRVARAQVKGEVFNSTRRSPGVSKACLSIRSFTAVPCHAGAIQVQPISTRRCAGVMLPKRVLPITRPLVAGERQSGLRAPDAGRRATRISLRWRYPLPHDSGPTSPHSTH